MLISEEPEPVEFEELLQNAKKKINQIYPEWTNYNPADSGMALLELFAYMTEMQQFHVKQLGTAHGNAFLHLMGMRPYTLQPAKVYARIEGIHAPFRLLKGTRVKVGDMCFEAEEAVYMESEERIFNLPQVPFYPFGENPGRTETFDIGMACRLKQDEIHLLYIDLYDDYPVKRTPVLPDTFVPLVRLELQYYDGAGYAECELIEDTTLGLLKTGVLKFRIRGRMEKKDKEYRLRLTAKGEYDTAPQIKNVYVNMVPFIQKDTVIEWQEYRITGGRPFYEIIAQTWLGVKGIVRIYQKTEAGYRRIRQYASFLHEGKRHFVIARETMQTVPDHVVFGLACMKEDAFFEDFVLVGNGKPDQEFYLPDRNILGTSFSVLVEEEPGCLVPWKPVTDLAQARQGECCYVLKEKEGILKFGNGIQGRMPRGRIEITAYAVCEGINGNIQKNQMMEFDGERKAEKAFNLVPAAGGRNPESIRECLERYKEEIKVKKRAVTNEDYEELVKQTPGLRIRKVKVFSPAEPANCIEVVALPCTNGGRHLKGDGYDKNILRHLESKRMLGTRITIKKADYIPVWLSIEVQVKNHVLKAESRIREYIKRYFDEQMDFGEMVSYSRLYGYIDSLPETAGIVELEVHADGRGVSRQPNKDIRIPFYGMVYLQEMELNCVMLEV